MALIACVDVDPFLVGLVRRLRPDDEVMDVDADRLAAARPRRYAAVVMAAQSPGVDQLQPLRLAERTLLVAQEGERVPPTHPGPVLRRPVDVSELRTALATVVPAGRWSALRGWLGTLPVATSVDGIFGVARLTAVVAGAALAAGGAPPRPPAALLALLLLWAVVRVWVRESTVGLVVGDLVLAVVGLALTGGPTSPFVLYVAVVSSEIGYVFPARTGAWLVGLGTVVGLVPIVLDIQAGRAPVNDVIGWGTLVPLSSVIGALGVRVRSGRSESVEMLRDLHSTLDRLSKQAQGVSGTLETSSVLEQIIASLREDLGARAGTVLVGYDGVHDVVASFGLAADPPSRLVIPASSRSGPLPSALVELLPDGQRLVCQLAPNGVHAGLLGAVIPAEANRAEAEAALQELAREAGLALDNARLFASIRELTIDEERRRLARDLHDGVVQSLVHVRFELDLVHRMLDDEHAQDIARLRDVVGGAVEEVRATVNDLRSVRLSAGLGTALLSLARELERPGLRIVVDAGPAEDLTPEASLQLLRVGQEAVSNAIHHGQATVVYVRLWQDLHHVHLQILDDGIGVDPAPLSPERGVGLRAMQERAELLGASLDLGPGAEGGTCVQIDVPLGRLQA